MRCACGGLTIWGGDRRVRLLTRVSLPEPSCGSVLAMCCAPVCAGCTGGACLRRATPAFGLHRASPGDPRLWSDALRAPSGLLGDASIPWRKGKPVLSVEFGQALKRDDYIWHLYDIFKDPVGRLCRHASTSTL